MGLNQGSLSGLCAVEPFSQMGPVVHQTEMPQYGACCVPCPHWNTDCNDMCAGDTVPFPFISHNIFSRHN